MRWKVETLGLLLAVTQGLVIQSPAHGNASPAPHRGCPPDPLGKITAKARHMEEQAKELFELYMTEQHLHRTEFSHLCHEAVPWIPTGHVPVLRRGALPDLHRTLQRLRGALQTIREQQQVLSHHGAALHEKLQGAQAAVGGLLSNVACTLKGAMPTIQPLSAGPRTLKSFHQRIEGCKVLRSYSQFLEALVKRLQRAPRVLTEKRKGRRGARRKETPSSC